MACVLDGEFLLKLVTWTMAPVYDDACCANDVWCVTVETDDLLPLILFVWRYGDTLGCNDDDTNSNEN